MEQPAAAVPSGRHPRRSLQRGPGVLARLVSAHLARTPAATRRLLLHGAVPAAKRPSPSGAGRLHRRALALATATFEKRSRSSWIRVRPKPAGFVTQTLVLAILLAGLGHVLRIPADLRANRLFHLAWLGQKDRYVDGVNRAAVAILIVPALWRCSPLTCCCSGYRWPPRTLLTGLLLGLVVLEALAAGRRARCRLPTATSPPADLNTRGPVIGIGALMLARSSAASNASALAGPRVRGRRSGWRSPRCSRSCATGRGRQERSCAAGRARFLSVGDGPAGSHRRILTWSDTDGLGRHHA